MIELPTSCSVSKLHFEPLDYLRIKEKHHFEDIVLFLSIMSYVFGQLDIIVEM